MLRTVHLTGPLAQFSKKPVKIYGKDMHQVIKGLCHMFGPKFKEIVRTGEWHITRDKKLKDVKSFDDTIGEEELGMGLGQLPELYLYKAIKAKSAIARIVVGVVLVVAGVFFKNPYLIQAGIGMALGGVAELLAPKPNTGAKDQSGQNPTFFFNGTVNVTEQGGAVPVICGRVPRASSLVLSAGISTENIGTSTHPWQAKIQAK